MMATGQYTETEKAIKRERKFLKNMMATIPDSLLVLDKDLRIKSANHSFYKLFQTRPKKVIGNKIADILGDEDGKFSAELTKLFGTKDMLENFELHYQSERLGERIFNITARGIIVAEEEEEEEEEEQQQQQQLVVIQDITERKQAEEEIKRRAAQAVLGYKVGQRVSSKLELNELLSEIVTAVRDALDYYGVMILLVDEEAQRLTMQSIAGGYVDIFPRHLYHAIGEGMTGYAAASGKTQVSGNVSKDPHYVREADEETKSELAVPIKRGQKVIGVLDIQSDEFDAFDETDVMLIETLADQIAVAIENARLYEAVQQELTGRKQAEEALRESERHFRALIENSSDIIQVVDSKGVIRYVSPSVQRILGYKPEELIGRLSIDVVHPDDFPLVAKGFEEALQKPGVPVITACRCKHKDGTWRVIEGTGINYLDYPAGNGFISNMHDITEHKQAVEALRKSEQNYRILFESKLDGVCVIDETMKLLLANQAAADMFGFDSPEEMLDVNPFDFISPQEREQVLAIVTKDMFEKDLQQVNEFQLMTKAGKEIWLSAVGARIEYQGKSAGLVSFRDITERRRAEEQLERSFIDLAETVSRAMGFRDPYTSSHQRRVAELARLVGEKMGLDEDRLKGLYIGGLLHDIGKISTPEVILSKPGELADEEWGLIHAHAKQGYLILKDTNIPWPVADMALHHHERLDGSGYPHGISGDKLSLEVRILGVCDVVEAMSSRRPYRPARSKEEVLEEIKNGRGTKYDANVVDAMLWIIEGGEFDFGEKGRFE